MPVSFPRVRVYPNVVASEKWVANLSGIALRVQGECTCLPAIPYNMARFFSNRLAVGDCHQYTQQDGNLSEVLNRLFAYFRALRSPAWDDSTLPGAPAPGRVSSRPQVPSGRQPFAAGESRGYHHRQRAFSPPELNRSLVNLEIKRMRQPSFRRCDSTGLVAGR